MATFDTPRGYWRANFSFGGKRITTVLKSADGKPMRATGKAAERAAIAAQEVLRAKLKEAADKAAAEAAARQVTMSSPEVAQSFAAVAASYLKTMKSLENRANRAAHIARLVRVPLTNPDEVVHAEGASDEERARDRRPIIDPSMDISRLVEDERLLALVPEMLRRRRVLQYLRAADGEGRYVLPGQRAEAEAERRAAMKPRKNASRKPVRIPAARTLSDTSVHHHLVTLGAVLRHAVRPLKLIAAVPDLPRVGIEERIPTPIPPHHFERIMECAAPHLRQGVALTYALGLRKHEAWHLTEAMVDLDAMTIRLPGAMTKNGKPVVIPITDGIQWLARELVMAARAAGRKRLLVYDDPTVDPRTGIRRGPRPISDPKSAWIGACERAGLRYRYHDIKAAFTSDLVFADVAAPLVKKLSRHADWSTTERYLALNPHQEREAMGKLRGRLGRELVSGDPKPTAAEG